MYVLNYNGKSKKFTTIPTIKEVEDFTGNLISFGLYDSIITNKIAHGMSGTYSLVKLPTIEQLNESWDSFLKEGIYIDQRYGQWHYNLYKHEVGNSYNIERPYKAYQVLYDDIVNSDDVEESK